MTGKITGDVIRTEKTGIISRLEKLYRVKRNEIIYVGDGLTDLPVIKKVGKGILFNPNALTRMEIYTNKALKEKENKGCLLLAEGRDLRGILKFI